MPQPSVWTLFAKSLFLAILYLKRECCRLADWTGVGLVVTVLIAAAISGALAATVTTIRGYGQVGVVFPSMALSFFLSASLLAYCALLKCPGGYESHYTTKREELSRLREQYAQQKSARQQALAERALQDAQRREYEELARRQAAQQATSAGPPAGYVQTAPAGGIQTGSSPGLPQQLGPQVIVVTATKSVGIAIILTFLFGPLGMLYSTVGGAIIMFLVTVPIGVCSGGLGLLLTHPICILWGALAASSYNSRLTRGIRQY